MILECLEAETGRVVFKERLSAGNARVERIAENEPPQQGGADRRSRRGTGGGRRSGRRERGGDDFASPVVAGDNIYLTTNAGFVHVVEAKAAFKLLATNDMTFDSSGFGATPAISDGKLFLRSNTHLYCVESAPVKWHVEVSRQRVCLPKNA